MAKIYISSTYSDLIEYREKVYRTLRQMKHDARAMEDYVATGKYPPLDKCLADVADSDLYIGIFAWRYGYIPDDGNPQQKSITELEYREATKKGKPCLIFLLDEEAPWLPNCMDKVTGDGNAGKRIEELRQELSKTKLVSFFKNPDDLAQKVSVAVQQWEQDNVGSLTEKAQTKYDLRNAKVYGFAPEGKDNIVVAGEKVEGNTIINDRSRHVSKGNRNISIGQGNYNENIQGDYIQGNKIDQSRNMNISGGTINATGAGALSLGDISGTVANTINQLPTVSDQSEIKKLLSNLKNAIAASENLDDKRKAKALKQVKILEIAVQDPTDEDLKESADDAKTMLEGIISKLPDTATLVTISQELLPAIAKFFGL